MIAGESKPKLLILQNAAGTALSYADKAAFQAASWDLTWRDVDGVALTAQPTWTIADEGAGLHRVKYVQPGGVYWVEITVPGTNYVSPITWANEGESYDDDAIAGLLLTAQGTPAVISADDSTLGDVVMGDAWSTGTLTIPVGKLTPFGYTLADLASGWTISAGAKNVPADASIALTAAFVVAGSGTFKVSWVTYPASMNLTSTETSKPFYIDVQLKKTSTGQIITTNRYSINAVWQRDTTA